MSGTDHRVIYSKERLVFESPLRHLGHRDASHVLSLDSKVLDHQEWEGLLGGVPKVPLPS